MSYFAKHRLFFPKFADALQFYFSRGCSSEIRYNKNLRYRFCPQKVVASSYSETLDTNETSSGGLKANTRFKWAGLIGGSLVSYGLVTAAFCQDQNSTNCKLVYALCLFSYQVTIVITALLFK